MSSSRSTSILKTALVLAALGGSVPPLGAAPASALEPGASASSTAAFASPTGTGACTAIDPCSVTKAVAKVPEGATVWLSPGDYKSVTLARRPAAEAWKRNVVVTPLPGAEVTMSELVVFTPHVTVQDITVRGMVYMKGSADHARLERLHVDGNGIFLRNSHTAVIDSVIENGDRVDGIQIAGTPSNEDVLIEGNVIRNYSQIGPGWLHADCVQLFDTQRVVIRGNHLSNCHGAGIIFSKGKGTGLADVLVEDNVIQGCVVKSAKCVGGSAVDARQGWDIRFVHNTVTDGSFRVRKGEGRVAINNILSYVSECQTPLVSNLIGGWNKGLCGSRFPFPTSNRPGLPSFVGQPATASVPSPVDTSLTDFALQLQGSTARRHVGASFRP